MKIQFARPKQTSNTTNPAEIPSDIRFHRLENKQDIAHNPTKITPTIRESAAETSDNNSITKVVEPIAINTRQKIIGARPS